MSAKAKRILLVGHDFWDGQYVRDVLGDVRDGSFIVECAPQLADGLERLREGGIAAVVLVLCLPDSRGIAAFEQIRRAAPLVPRRLPWPAATPTGWPH
jgi:DNA-binding response OmpR family regulator